jgi:autotransporter-associated beta strand protein
LQANAGNTTAGVTTVLSVTSTQLQLGNNSTLQLRADAPTTFFDTTATNAISMNGNTVNIDVNQLTGAGTNNTLTLDPAGFTAGGSTINVTGGNGYNLALGVITNPTNTTIDTLNPTTANVNLAGFTASLSANTHATLALSGTSTANTVSGIITDNSGASFTVALIKSGTSVWTLSGANTYTGGTTINAGVLSLNNSGALGSSGGIVFNGGTLQFSGNNNTDYSSRITISDGDTATLDTNNVNVTLGTALTLGNAKSGALAKVGAGTIDITAANLFTGGTTVNGGTVVLGITGALASGSNVANNAALEVSAATTLGNVSGTGTTTVDATQSLTANNFSQAGGLVNNGTTQINGNGTVGPISGAGTLVVGSGTSANTLKLATGSGLNTQTSLSIAAGATLDVNNDHFIINYGAGSDPISAIYGDLKSGYNGGTWNGPGIISSAARTPTNLLHYGVGFADGNDGTHAVAGLTSGEIELKYTLLGDANLDGTVNGSDFSILAANFGLGVTNWDQGNFLYGPSVNGSDFSALAANFGQGDSGAAGSVSQADISALDAFAAANDLSMPTISAVPEPASVGLLIAASAGMLSRRRRRS